MTLVFLLGLGEYQDVVQVGHAAPVQPWTEDRVHDAAEVGRRVAQPERRNEELEESVTRAESRLVHVLRVHGNLVVPLLHIQHRKVFRPSIFLFVKLRKAD